MNNNNREWKNRIQKKNRNNYCKQLSKNKVNWLSVYNWNFLPFHLYIWHCDGSQVSFQKPFWLSNSVIRKKNRMKFCAEENLSISIFWSNHFPLLKSCIKNSFWYTQSTKFVRVQHIELLMMVLKRFIETWLNDSHFRMTSNDFVLAAIETVQTQWKVQNLSLHSNLNETFKLTEFYKKSITTLV